MRDRDNPIPVNPFEATLNHAGELHHPTSSYRNTTRSTSPSTRAVSVVTDSGNDTETDAGASSAAGLRRRAGVSFSTSDDRKMEVDE